MKMCHLINTRCLPLQRCNGVFLCDASNIQHKSSVCVSIHPQSLSFVESRFAMTPITAANLLGCVSFKDLATGTFANSSRHNCLSSVKLVCCLCTSLSEDVQMFGFKPVQCSLGSMFRVTVLL